MRRSVAAIVLSQDRVLVARRPFGGAVGGLWEFPGGKVEEGEDDRTALEREFLEEFGAGLTVLRPLGETSFLHKGADRGLAGWLCELPPATTLSLAEHLECRWLGASELQSLDLVDSDRKLLPYVLELLADLKRQSENP